MFSYCDDNFAYVWLLISICHYLNGNNGIPKLFPRTDFTTLTLLSFPWTICQNINPIQDGLFRGCWQMGEGQKDPPSLKPVKHILQWWNLAQLYLIQKISKKYMNHVTHPLSSAGISIFSLEISKFSYITKHRYRLYFDT